jgi:hypothetical protein
VGGVVNVKLNLVTKSEQWSFCSLRIRATDGRKHQFRLVPRSYQGSPPRSEELNAWLGTESGKPVHVATENTDLTGELKRGLSFVRREKEPSIGRGLAGRSKKVRRK